MQQMRLHYPARTAGTPSGRAIVAVVGLLLALGVAGLLLVVVLPLLGIIISAAVGGMILTLAGVVMMIPMLLLSGVLLMVFGRPGAGRRQV